MSTLKVSAINNAAAGSGGLAISADGNVSGAGMDLITSQSFTAASAVNVNNCFTSTYQNYRIVVSGRPSTTNNVQFRWRVSGTDVTASNYAYIRNGSRTTGANACDIGKWDMPDAGNTTLGNSVDVYRPLDNKYPSFAGIGFSGESFVTFETIAAQYRAAISPDGFTIFASTGTFTGTLRVYGYRN
jgi:hypothetical protein